MKKILAALFIITMSCNTGNNPEVVDSTTTELRLRPADSMPVVTPPIDDSTAVVPTSPTNDKNVIVPDSAIK